jgi:anaerobic magnesium-protoporphyrin IX monomethyl ester cyclase
MPKVGPNAPCPCGSGLAYKKCHGSPEPVSSGTPKLVTIRRPTPEAVRLESERRIARFTAEGPKKLVLAYHHYSTVTSPPLGVAYLKGHLQRTLPQWSVKVIDLNLEAHQHAVRNLDATVIRAAETFRGEHPDDFYDGLDQMVLYARLWTRNMRSALDQPARDARSFLGKEPMSDIIERHAELLLAEAPTAIGVSTCYVEQFCVGLCLAKVLRQRAPDMPLLFGGTMFKEGIDAIWGAERWPVDYIVGGAGELPLVEILAGRAESGTVPGVTLVEGTQLRSTPPFYDNDFTEIADADFSDFDARAYYSPEPIYPIQTTRGCYWKRCTFCNHYKTVGGSYQLRTMDNLIAELRRHIDAGVRHFTFVDDIISPARFNNMSKAILEAKLDLRYYAMTRPMKHFSRETLQRMYDAGCRFVLWGIESGSQRVLDLMEKGTIVAEVEKCLELSASVGIKNHVFVICGFPTETREEFQETLDFLERVRPHVHCVHKTLFGLERGTPVFDNPEKFAITRMKTEGGVLYDFDCAQGMTRAAARRALDEARPFFRSFATGKELAKGDFRFRDHMLLLYCRNEKARHDAELAASAQ